MLSCCFDAASQAEVALFGARLFGGRRGRRIMCACKTLARTSICSFGSKFRITARTQRPFVLGPIRQSHPPCTAAVRYVFSPQRCRDAGLLWGKPEATRSICHSIGGVLSSTEIVYVDEGLCEDSNELEGLPMDALEKLLPTNRVDNTRFFKMERKSSCSEASSDRRSYGNWFPYLDRYKIGETSITSGDVLEALDPFIMETRKERFLTVVKNRTYSVSLVIEGLNDVGNASAIFRSADALGFQSVHVVAFGCSKRFRTNRNVSMGAQKWLDIEVWDSIKECFDALKSRGYCIAATHVGTKAVSVYEMDWSSPTAIVVGNEKRGISDEALELADTIISIPMKGMVESFNVSVASALVMHHALCDRTFRLGCHGDLKPLEQQILLAEFSLRHSHKAISIVHEHTRRKGRMGNSDQRQYKGP